MHDDTLDAHADNGRKLVRTIISPIGIRSIISPVGVGIIISSIGIGSIISPIVIWISRVRTPIGSTIDPPDMPTVGSIIVLCIIWLSWSGLRQVTQPCGGRGWGRYRSAGSDSENEHGSFHCIEGCRRTPTRGQLEGVGFVPQGEPKTSTMVQQPQSQAGPSICDW
jgi:hypothetical protein